MSRAIPKRRLPHTVTLYNAVGKNDYNVVILKNVHFEQCKKSNVDKLGSKDADSVFLVIDAINSKALSRNGFPLKYLPPKEFALSNKQSVWTLQDGNKDYFVLGDTDMAYDKDINGLKSRYETYRVNIVDTLYNPTNNKIHHFEVSGV